MNAEVRASGTTLAGKVAVVTGGSRGIGRAVAIELARQGADVAVGLRSESSRTDVLTEIGALGQRVVPITLDVRDLEQSRRQLDSVESVLGPVDILINNAGGSILGNALDVTESDFQAVWELNVRSTFFLSQHVTRRYSNLAG